VPGSAAELDRLCRTRDDGARSCDRPAVHDLLAHARELVQARLDHIEHRDVGCDRAIVDRHDEGLELVGEIAMGVMPATRRRP